MKVNNKIKSIIMSHVDYIQQDEGVNSIEIRIEDIDQIINEIVILITEQEKDKIIDAWVDGRKDGYQHIDKKYGEVYYNEKYNNQTRQNTTRIVTL
jgi:hypothetical protein